MKSYELAGASVAALRAENNGRFECSVGKPAPPPLHPFARPRGVLGGSFGKVSQVQHLALPIQTTMLHRARAGSFNTHEARFANT